MKAIQLPDDTQMNTNNGFIQNMVIKRIIRIFKLLWNVLLAAFTTYVLLDTFVIPRVYAVTDSRTPGMDFEEGTVIKAEALTMDSLQDKYIVIGEYEDEHCSVLIKQYREYNSDIFVAEISLANVSILQAAFAHNTYGRNISDRTSGIANDSGAILAINGDYYGVHENGYVIRNGILYRNIPDQNSTDLVVYSDGSMEVVDENAIRAEDLLEKGAWQVFAFGPELISYGTETSNKYNRSGYSIEHTNPRTAIGYIEPLHYVFVVANGRTEDNAGLTFDQLAEFMKLMNCSLAYNLDGGGSSTMYFQGSVINTPSDRNGVERNVSDIVSINVQ